jgi:hypothetical protein
MKITFEGHFVDLVAEIESFLATVKRKGVVENTPNKNYESKPVAPAAQGPGPDVFAAGDKPVDKPVDKPAKPVNPQIAKMQAAKAAKKAEREAAAAAPKEKALPPPPKTAEGMDPAEVVALRTKTIAELQEAYANGHQKEVFELLSRFGNGAKSFRELPPDAFVPIREAIDNGALT